MSQEEQKPKTQKTSKKMAMLNKFTAFAAATSVFFSFSNFIIPHQENQVKQYEEKLSLIEKFDDQGKLYIVLKIGFMMAIFLFLNTILVMLIRMITGRSNPVKFQDLTIVVALNRIIQNSIEQFFIFGFNYAYFIYFRCTQEQAMKSFVLGALFVKARYIFLFAYAIGVMINVPSLRTFGFAINVIIQVIFLSENLGYPIINKFV